MLIDTSQYILDYSNFHDPELNTLLEEMIVDSQITQILVASGFKYEISPKSNQKLTIIIVRGDDRLAAKATINKLLTKHRINHQDGVVSSKSIDLRSTDIPNFNGMKYRLMFKPMSAGGSGAGAAVTALGESFQAYACDARQRKGRDLVDVEEIFEYVKAKEVQAERTIEECQSKLSPHWLRSGLVIANAFANGAGSGGKFRYHHGSKLVKSIEAEFWRLAKNEGIKMNINKWSPADIWAAHPSFKEQNIKNFRSLSEYNQFILEQFKAKKLMGISLKVVKGDKAIEELYNYDINYSPTFKFNGVNIGNKRIDFFDPKLSKSVHLYYKINGKPAEIYFRTFTGGITGFSGEIIGKFAAGGKIGPTALEDIMERIGISKGEFYSAKDFKSFFSGRDKEPPEHILLKYLEYYKILHKKERRKPMQLLPELRAQYKVKEAPWFYSKYLGMQNVALIIKNRKIEKFLAEIVMYASSSTAHSAVFVKYS